MRVLKFQKKSIKNLKVNMMINNKINYNHMKKIKVNIKIRYNIIFIDKNLKLRANRI